MLIVSQINNQPHKATGKIRSPNPFDCCLMCIKHSSETQPFTIMETHVSWVRNNVEYLHKWWCRTTKSTLLIAIVAWRRRVCCIGWDLQRNINRSSHRSEYCTLFGCHVDRFDHCVERHIVAVDRVYDDERGHQAIGVKGRVISISGGGSGNQKRRVDPIIIEAVSVGKELLWFCPFQRIRIKKINSLLKKKKHMRKKKNWRRWYSMSVHNIFPTPHATFFITLSIRP